MMSVFVAARVELHRVDDRSTDFLTQRVKVQYR
jgi:hypothetical protein